MRIVAADDDPITLRMIDRILTAAGHAVETVPDGAAAMELLQSRPIDLLLTDWMMPGVDGPRLIRWLRGAELSHYVYIILLTVRDADDDVADALELGADDYITKPFGERELVARVALGKRQRALQDGAAGDAEGGAAPGTADPAAAEIVPPDGPAIDRSALDQLRELGSGGESDFPQQVLELFHNEAPMMLRAAGTAAADGDARALRLSAHSLKASGQGIGATRLAALAKALEEIGRAGDVRGAGALLAEAEREYERVASAIADLRRAPPGARAG